SESRSRVLKSSARADHSLRGKYFCGTRWANCRQRARRCVARAKRAHRKRLRGVGARGDGVAQICPSRPTFSSFALSGLQAHPCLTFELHALLTVTRVVLG